MAYANEQANHTIQSPLSASVFQMAISEIKRLGNSSEIMLFNIIWTGITNKKSYMKQTIFVDTVIVGRTKFFADLWFVLDYF